MDLDQSNAPGALAWSGSIRSVGLGRRSMGFRLFVISWILLLIAPFFLAIWTSVHYIFLAKIPKKIAMRSWYVSLLFSDIFTYSRLMEIVRVNFTLWFVHFVRFRVDFLVQYLIRNLSCDVDVWHLSYDEFAPDVVLILSIGVVNWFCLQFLQYVSGIIYLILLTIFCNMFNCVN